MPAPISVPMRPISTVSHAGIGSGPGTAKRASAPVKNAVTMIQTTAAMAPSVSRHDPNVASSTPTAPFLRGFRLRARGVDDYSDELPALRSLDRIELDPCVTFFVGENGSGKSTLVEALAGALKLNVESGGRAYQFNFSTRATHSRLRRRIELDWRSLPPRNSFFLRAESIFNLSTAIENSGSVGEMQKVFQQPLHEQSHGESFLDVAMNRLAPNGLYLFDEPEAALSLRGQLALMRRMHELAAQDCQFVVATHSPILLGYPDATIYALSDDGVRAITYDEAPQVELTRAFLDEPQRFLRHLLADEDAR
jgi:predicted ATPase